MPSYLAAAVAFSAATLVSGAAILDARATEQASSRVAKVTLPLKAATQSAPLSLAASAIEVMLACDGYDFADPCWYISVPTFNNCYALAPELDKVISSMHVLATDVQCLVYFSKNCSGSAGGIDGTMGPLGRISPAFDNAISSIRCLVI